LQHNQSADENGQGQAVPKNGAQNGSGIGAFGMAARCDAGHNNALGIDHFAHYPARTICRGHEHGRKIQALRGHLLQIAEEHVGRRIAAREGYAEPADKRREKRKQTSARSQRQAQGGIGAAVTRRKSEGQH